MEGENKDKKFRFSFSSKENLYANERKEDSLSKVRQQKESLAPSVMFDSVITQNADDALR